VIVRNNKTHQIREEIKFMTAIFSTTGSGRP